MFSLIKIPRLNLIRVRRKVSNFLSGLHQAREGKQFATSHLFLTQRENYIRVACSAIIILATNLVIFFYITKLWAPFQVILNLHASRKLALHQASLPSFLGFVEKAFHFFIISFALNYYQFVQDLFVQKTLKEY